jgi:hypothetical protein
VQFPDLDTRTLQGVDKRLPSDLPAERTLLLLPFRQWQQRQVDAWIGRADDAGWAADLTAGDAAPPFAVLEVPCISRRWSVGRSFIDGGMAASIRVPKVLARTWTAYTDVGRVQRALDITDSEQTWVGVLTQSGEVLAHAAGEPTSRSWPPIAAAMTG